MHHWLDRVALQELPVLWLDTWIQEIDTDDATNKYGYKYNVYYPSHLGEEPIGIVFYKKWVYQFFHHPRIEDPYLGPIHKKATKYEVTNNSTITDKETEDQLTLQIYQSLVIIDKDQPESPKRTRESWAPDSTPTITPATYTTQQTQPRLSMATKTIVRMLTESASQQDITQQLPQSSNKPGRFGGSVPFGADQLGTSRAEEAQIWATLVNAFCRHLCHHRGGEPPNSEDPRDGGSEPSDDEPNGTALQDHIPIPVAHDVRPMGSLPCIFDGDQTKAEAFLTEYLGYLMLNQGVLGFELPIRQVMMALTLIKGDKVDL